MDRKSYLLICLAEECSEITQRVSKALRFGLTEVQPGWNADNITRLCSEVNDLLGVVEMCKKDVPGFNLNPEQIELKKEKVERYFAYSKKMGIVKE